MFNPAMSSLIQKHCYYTDNLNSDTSGDSKNAFLHCADVTAIVELNTPERCMPPGRIAAHLCRTLQCHQGSLPSGLLSPSAPLLGTNCLLSKYHADPACHVTPHHKVLQLPCLGTCFSYYDMIIVTITTCFYCACCHDDHVLLSFRHHHHHNCCCCGCYRCHYHCCPRDRLCRLESSSERFRCGCGREWAADMTLDQQLDSRLGFHRKL